MGCGNNDPAPGSTIMTMGGSGGGGGAAGNTLDLGLGAGKGGGGMGGGGAAAGGAATAGGNAQGGTSSMAGGANHAGSSSVGGSKPAGTCMRAPGSDADCIELDESSPQAWSCTDRGAFRTLDDMHGNKCVNGNIVPGAPVSGCCAP